MREPFVLRCRKIVSRRCGSRVRACPGNVAAVYPLDVAKDTHATLARVCDHIDHVQEVLGRRILPEKLSTDMAFAETAMSEVGFPSEVTRRTGCRLLLDVNDVYVSGIKQNYDPLSYIDAFPLSLVGEMHRGGHDEDRDDRADGSCSTARGLRPLTRSGRFAPTPLPRPVRAQP